MIPKLEFGNQRKMFDRSRVMYRLERFNIFWLDAWERENYAQTGVSVLPGIILKKCSQAEAWERVSTRNRENENLRESRRMRIYEKHYSLLIIL